MLSTSPWIIVCCYCRCVQIFQGIKWRGKESCWEVDGISSNLVESFLFSFFLSFVNYYTVFLINYSNCSQNKRGGKVKLHSIVKPLSEFDNEEKGDALYGEIFLFLLHQTSILNSLIDDDLYLLFSHGTCSISGETCQREASKLTRCTYICYYLIVLRWNPTSGVL